MLWPPYAAQGSPVAPLLADVIMNHVIDQALTKINIQNKPIFLWRYVDDIFVAFNDMSALDISLIPSTVYIIISLLPKNWSAVTLLPSWMF